MLRDALGQLREFAVVGALAAVVNSVCAQNDALYPELIDAKSFYVPSGAWGTTNDGWFVHELGQTNRALFKWGLSEQEAILAGVPSRATFPEDIFPLLGEVEVIVMDWNFQISDTSFTYDVYDGFLYEQIDGGSYNNENNPVGYEEPQSFINDNRVAWIDLGFEFRPPHGMEVVQFDESTLQSDIPFGRRAIVTHDANWPEHTPAGNFEYIGPISGGAQHFWPCITPQPPITTFLLPSKPRTISSNSTVPNPTNLTVPPGFAMKLQTASTPRWGVTGYDTNDIRDASKWTWSEMGRNVQGTMLWRASVKLTHSYRPRTPVGYAIAISQFVVANEPAMEKEPTDLLKRVERSDRHWNCAIALRETSQETSSLNNALRDAEYFWRGFSGGLQVTDWSRSGLPADPGDFLNYLGNTFVPQSQPVYNLIKGLLILTGVKETVPPEDDVILERLFNGELKQKLAGTELGSLLVEAPANRGWVLGLEQGFKLLLGNPATFGEVESVLHTYESNHAGYFPSGAGILLGETKNWIGDLTSDLLQRITPSPSQSSANGESTPVSTFSTQSVQPLELVEAYIDTLEEARLAQCFYFRASGESDSSVIPLDYQPGSIQTPPTLNLTGDTFVANAAAGEIIRGTVTLNSAGNNITSLRVEGPVSQTLTGRLWFFADDGKLRHLAAGDTVDLEIGSPGGTSSVTIGGMDGADLANSQFQFHVTTATDEQAFFGQTVYYRAEQRSEDPWGDDFDNEGIGDGLSDQWERDHFGSTTRAGSDSDTDGDGIPALAEMISATHPGDPLSRPVLRLGTVAPDHWTISLPVRIGLEDRILPQQSADLESWEEVWSALTPEMDEDQSGMPSGAFRARYRINHNAPPSLFFRALYMPEPLSWGN